MRSRLGVVGAAGVCGVLWLLAAVACSGDQRDGAGAASGAGANGSSASTASNGSGGATSSTGAGAGFSCANPAAEWLLCEDFEQGGGEFDTWLANSDFIGGPGTDDRGRTDLSGEHARSGAYSLHMPADAASGYQGASLDWWACSGEQTEGCTPLNSYEQLYFRVWVRFAEDHRYIHHFLNIAGSQPDDFWYHGTAGCLPNGELAMGTTVDYQTDTHKSFFYTYHPGMSCDANCGNYADVASICAECANKGLPTCQQQQQCCWGNHYEAATPHHFPVGDWFCFEMMMKANAVGMNDGEMAYWVDDEEIHRESSMLLRTSPTLALNRVRVQHYITSGDANGFSNRVWFDDAVVSTQRVGCQAATGP